MLELLRKKAFEVTPQNFHELQYENAGFVAFTKKNSRHGREEVSNLSITYAWHLEILITTKQLKLRIRPK